MSNPKCADKYAAFATRKTVHRKLSLSSLRTIVSIVIAGLLTGQLIVNPNKRVIEAIVGLILVSILWTASSFHALLFFILAYPFPFAISIGNSDFVFILIISVISLIRAPSTLASFRKNKIFNLPILLLVASYALSFYNVDYTGEILRSSLMNTYAFVAAVMLFYLCVNSIDSEEKLKKALDMLLISTSLSILFTLFELLFPGKVIIPNWLYTQQETTLIAKNLRMRGPFHDFELLAEYFALNAPLIFLFLIRSKALSARVIYALLLFADLFMMFATITRGAFVTLTIGFIYMAIICRRDLNFFRITVITATFLLLLVGIEAFVSRYTSSGSLFGRFKAETQFEYGIIPINRAYAWKLAISRGMKHLFIGNGPGWQFAKSLEISLSPHNVYLFIFNITGLFGLFAFLFFLYRLLKVSAMSIHASLVSAPLLEALMKVFHVWLIMFIIDQIKIEYLRNDIYVYFIWLFFGFIAATRNIMIKNKGEQALPVPPS